MSGQLTPEKMREWLTPAWTAEDRMLALAVLLPSIQDDIYAGAYSAIGRPNITSLQGILFEPADVLEAQGIRQLLAHLVDPGQAPC